jgi:transposase
MNIHPTCVGIDISKATLDVADGAVGHVESFANTASAADDLAKRWQRQGSFVVFEATAPYDRHIKAALETAGVCHARVNPLRARDFARALGVLAKTDAVDARMLAVMAGTIGHELVQPSPPRHGRLTELNRRRDQLVAMRAQERTRLSESYDDDERDSLSAHIDWLSADIARIERTIQNVLVENQDLKRTWMRLRSAPGIGKVTATTLLVHLPELGARSPKAIAALAGLAPRNRDSGTYRGHRHIAGGRKRVRDALYMAALTAARTCPRLRDTYQAMINAGKPPKVALIAIARKLLTSLNAMARDEKTYVT